MAQMKWETLAIIGGVGLVLYAVAPGVKKFFDKTGEAGASVAGAAEGASNAIQGLGSGAAQVSQSGADVAKEIAETINAPLNLIQQLYSDLGDIGKHTKKSLLGNGNGGGSKKKTNTPAPPNTVPNLSSNPLTFATQGSSAAQQMQAIINPATTLIANLLGVKSNTSNSRVNTNTVLYTGPAPTITAPGVSSLGRATSIVKSSVLYKS